MRSIWKGHIRFSLVTIPIRIYNAVDTEETIRFNQLHKDDNGAVGYEKKCKKCGKALSAEEIVKGYQFEPEQYVIVSPEDLAKIKLQSTKVIEIEGFIDAGEVQPSLYESPYFAGPDGGLILYKLRHPHELRKIESVPKVEHKEVNKDELKLSINLIESMASTLKELD